MRYFALIPAAGSGSRFKGEFPKQYWRLDGKPLLLHSVERLQAGLPLASTLVAIAGEDRWFDTAVGAVPGVTPLRCGGATRGESVRAALRALSGAQGDDWIVVHDAVRPCVDRDALSRLRLEIGDDPVGGLLALPLVGTLKRADAEGRSERTEPREGLWSAQTPQMFRYAVLRDALERGDAAKWTDEAQAVEALGLKPRLIAGSASNIKITFPDDILLAAAIMSVQRGA